MCIGTQEGMVRGTVIMLMLLEGSKFPVITISGMESGKGGILSMRSDIPIIFLKWQDLESTILDSEHVVPAVWPHHVQYPQAVATVVAKSNESKHSAHFVSLVVYREGGLSL